MNFSMQRNSSFNFFLQYWTSFVGSVPDAAGHREVHFSLGIACRLEGPTVFERLMGAAGMKRIISAQRNSSWGKSLAFGSLMISVNYLCEAV
jgi:hypothetical protein